MKKFALKFIKYIKTSSYKEKISFFLLFFIGISLIFFSIFIKSNKQPKFGGVYTEGIFEKVNTLNPLLVEKDSEKSISNIIYPPLIEIRNNQIFSKFLKSFFKSKDGLTYEIELKDNIKWSDGSSVTTDDIMFSFDAFKKYGSGDIKKFFQNVEFKPLDKTKGQFLLKENDNYFFYRLIYFQIIPSKYFAKYNLTEIPEEIFQVGSGPFVLEKIDQKNGFQIIYLKRNNFYNSPVYLDKIIFITYPNSKRAFDALLSREIDGLAGINYFKMPISLFYNYEIKRIVLPRIIGIFFNGQSVDKDIVKFLDLKIDRNLISEIFSGNGEISRTIFSTTLRKIWNLPGFSRNITNEAKNLNFKNIEITIPSIYFYPEIGRVLKEKYNISTKIVAEDKIKNIIKSRDYQALLYGFNLGHPPALFFFWSQSGININNVQNVSLEKEYQKLITDPNVNFAEEFAKIEKMIINSNLNIFLVNPYYLYVINKDIETQIENYLPGPEFRFNSIDLWYKK